MEVLGISDYYLALTQYINNFVNNNYPLSKDDMAAIISGMETDNILKRNVTTRVLKDSMVRLLGVEV